MHFSDNFQNNRVLPLRMRKYSHEAQIVTLEAGLLWAGVAYFLCIGKAHVTDFKVFVLFVYFIDILPEQSHLVHLSREIPPLQPSLCSLRLSTLHTSEYIGCPSRGDEETRQRLGAETRDDLVQEGYAGLLGTDCDDRRRRLGSFTPLVANSWDDFTPAQPGITHGTILHPHNLDVL